MKKSLFPVLFFLFLALALCACAAAAPTEAEPTAADLPYPAGAEGLQSATVYPASPVQTTPDASGSTETPTEVPPDGLPLYSLRMFPNGQGWAADWNHSALYHSSDGGLTWTDVSPADVLAGASGGYYSFFLSGNTAWLSVPVFENSILLRTTDAGTTWNSTSLDFPAGNPQFLDGSNGFLFSRLDAAAGSEYVALYQSSDGGATWEQRFSHEAGQADPDLPTGGQKTGFVFPDLNNGWVSGSEPINDFVYLFRSYNSGVNWFLVDLILPDGVTDAAIESFPPVFFSPTDAVLPLRVYLSDVSARSWFYQTADGGETWTFRSEANPAAQQFVFADALNWLLLGESGFYRSRDGGASWEELSTGLPAGFTPLALDLSDANNGWMLAAADGDSSMNSNFLFHSADGGLHWELLPARIAD